MGSSGGGKPGNEEYCIDEKTNQSKYMHEVE